MFAKSITAAAILAFAAQTLASEAPLPYKANKLVKMSVHEMFGVGRRQDNGYTPSQSVCGSGSTCAEACGAGYETCTSSDSTVHCFDAGAGQTCCPDASGNSCDAGYYCTMSSSKVTVCCPDTMNLAQCAAAYTVSGTLASETTSATSSSATSSSAPSTTSAANSTTSAITAASTGFNGTTTYVETDTVTTCTASVQASVTFPSSNTTTATHVTTGTPSASRIAVSAGSVASSSFDGLVLLAVAFVALL